MSKLFSERDKIPVAPLAITALDTDVAIHITYEGPAATATVEVNAGGDVIFLADGSADTTVGLPTLDGTLDVSESGATTMGELVDNINASANWRARLGSALRGDTSTDTLLLMAASNAKGVELALYRDTSTVLRSSKYCIGQRLSVRNLTGKRNADDVRLVLTNVHGKATSANTHTGFIWAVHPTKKTQRLVFSWTPVTATYYVLDAADWGEDGLIGAPGEEFVVSHEVTTAEMTAPEMTLTGYAVQVGVPSAQKYAPISAQ